MPASRGLFQTKHLGDDTTFILQHDDRSLIIILSMSIVCEVLKVQPSAISHIDAGGWESLIGVTHWHASREFKLSVLPGSHSKDSEMLWPPASRLLPTRKRNRGWDTNGEPCLNYSWEVYLGYHCMTSATGTFIWRIDRHATTLLTITKEHTLKHSTPHRQGLLSTRQLIESARVVK